VRRCLRPIPVRSTDTPPFEGTPGKEETFRCRRGVVYLYVEGEPTAHPAASPPPGRCTVFREVVHGPGEQHTIPRGTLHWFQAGAERRRIRVLDCEPRQVRRVHRSGDSADTFLTGSGDAVLRSVRTRKAIASPWPERRIAHAVVRSALLHSVGGIFSGEARTGDHRFELAECPLPRQVLHPAVRRDDEPLRRHHREGFPDPV
jgi:hypothetical protein